MDRLVSGQAKEITLYTTSEVARLMKLHPSTVVSWREGRGNVKLPFVKLGRSVRYRHSDVMSLLSERMFVNRAEAQERR